MRYALLMLIVSSVLLYVTGLGCDGAGCTKHATPDESASVTRSATCMGTAARTSASLVVIIHSATQLLALPMAATIWGATRGASVTSYASRWGTAVKTCVNPTPAEMSTTSANQPVPLEGCRRTVGAFRGALAACSCPMRSASATAGARGWGTAVTTCATPALTCLSATEVNDGVAQESCPLGSGVFLLSVSIGCALKARERFDTVLESRCVLTF
eukprot:CAMPEP_0113933700 /NCGR_PEP_ID=MMETSP1339-20121228/1022_1 /TAXON_ID=94617 /ORGANISM="Fibrocapsa japonica" /LENGTH=214 /DNA_ID=CAMNT_0000935141 /DNA_START=40 /DNA_END=685 /DNA_ORIENTATION=- /assembly_acc=CAM_ASM_000762